MPIYLRTKCINLSKEAMMVFDSMQFQQLFTQLMQVNLYADMPSAKLPFPLPQRHASGALVGNWPTAAQIGSVITPALPTLPLRYQDAYGHKLLARLENILETAMTNEQPTLVATLVGAIYDHTVDALAPALRRFLAVNANLYGSFWAAETRAQLNLPLIERLPPLATFKDHGDQGPFTITPDHMLTLTDSAVGVVSLPGTYHAYPLLWGALSHEVAGHDLIHADVGLLAELTECVGAALAEAGFPAAIISLWRYWLDESAADVCGVLNLGPAFGLNLLLLLLLLNAQGPQALHGLRIQSTPGDASGMLDTHPTDLLRLYLVIGVVAHLPTLAQSHREAAVAMLEAATNFCTPTTNQFILRGYLPQDDKTQPVPVRTYPLSLLTQSAQVVGKTIAYTPMQAFAGYALADIETWDDEDEEITQTLVTAMQQNQSIVGLGDSAHALAAATQLLYQNAALYTQVVGHLEDALDASFQQELV